MSSIDRKGSPVPERESYTLELITSPRKSGPPAYILKTVLVPNCKYRWNPNSPSDPEFNLSAKLGNDNGSFIWGRSAFEHTGRNFSLNCEYGSMACVFTGELMDIHGVYKEASINLDEKLKVEEYVDETTYETFHRLTERRPTPPERSLVLCFDGTSNHFSKKNTNVVKLVELLKKNDPARQMVYYQTGVGTYAPPGMITSVGLKLAEKADEAAAWFLYQHVIDGYKYLMETYRIGDSISIFGFSRGAFTARALAGMLHCVGLLPKHNVEHVPFAYQVYAKAKDYNYGSCGASKVNNSKRNRCHAAEVDPDDFKKTFCTSVKVDFVGVWDTVASVGALFPKTLPWIEYNPCIDTFRQALALDERRGNFIPSVWDHRYTNHSVQDVREVWFRGEHSDVGGGSAGPVTKPSKVRGQPDEVDRTMLSNITLRWMVRQIIECRTGILFDYTAVDEYRAMGILESPPLDDLGTCWDGVRRVEESIQLDKVDIKRPIYDSIGWSILWNPLELAPTAKPKKTKEFAPTTTRMPNAKKGRAIYRAKDTDPIFIHSSVVDYLASSSLEATDEDYKPRATWYGYGPNELPRVEDVPHANIVTCSITHRPKFVFPEQAKQKLKLVEYKKTPGVLEKLGSL